MEKGTHRTCIGCKKIFIAEYFPFKSVDLCLDCWEEKHHRSLHAFRKKWEYTDIYNSTNDEIILSEKILQYLKNNPGEKAKTIASDLGADKKQINFLLYVKLRGKCIAKNYCWYLKWQLNEKNTDNFTKEFDVETIKTYIKNKKANNKPIVFYYRNDSFPRIIHEYVLDGNYIRVITDEGQHKTFLIDKIKKLE